MLTYQRVSKVVAHALRHEPWVYELELDGEGWVPVAELLDALQAKGGDWSRLGAADLAAMVMSSPKRRYELEGDRIRARYGHSVPGRLVRERLPPPEFLFHGTSPRAWTSIRSSGLLPMNRQYVHLSVDRDQAVQVALRKGPDPLVLRVGAGDAAREGVPFYRGNEYVWLADSVPARYLGAAGPLPDPTTSR